MSGAALSSMLKYPDKKILSKEVNNKNKCFYLFIKKIENKYNKRK